MKALVPAKLEATREIEKEFEAAVYRTWKAPLDLLDLLLYVSLEAWLNIIVAIAFQVYRIRTVRREDAESPD